ncbi:MAG: hypothetical protein P0Y49_09235 [Candidatus Pedobacter colombiensis]|uniref:Phosphoadenosine phosphosulphate reductase domain-containing protein n=1 Tax=Candidatus Pedobacter colombiensis TaxID=3121371 RepID=A0AAJ5W9M5_9SPHI|nr:hypothetical protein [Pedobacter sp.]WEK21323.1 MAG: hypothetical protein P0Y49_09235 [Pedobacter sp.]
MKRLTILSFGAGQDSTCILYRIIRDPDFRQRYVQGDFIVVMSNTGNEHPHTYRHIRFIKTLCSDHHIPFFFLNSSMGYHPRTWLSLIYQYRRNNNIMSLMFPRTCTDNLKIKPIYNFLDHYIAQTYYGYQGTAIPKGKKYIKRFSSEYGKIRIILGIAAGEEKRIKKTNRKTLLARQLNLFQKQKRTQPVWMEASIQKVYPLIEQSMDRQACQQYILQTGWPLPYPSNCMMCPFISKPELLWLFRNLPAEFYKWVVYEQNKKKRFNNRTVNYGVKGGKTLSEILQEAIAEFGHMSDQELDQYKMSHGHCVQSSF